MASALINMSKVESVGGLVKGRFRFWHNVGAGFGSADGITFVFYGIYKMSSSDVLFGGPNDGKLMGSLIYESLELNN